MSVLEMSMELPSLDFFSSESYRGDYNSAGIPEDSFSEALPIPEDSFSEALPIPEDTPSVSHSIINNNHSCKSFVTLALSVGVSTVEDVIALLRRDSKSAIPNSRISAAGARHDMTVEELAIELSLNDPGVAGAVFTVKNGREYAMISASGSRLAFFVPPSTVSTINVFDIEHVSRLPFSPAETCTSVVYTIRKHGVVASGDAVVAGKDEKGKEELVPWPSATAAGATAEHALAATLKPDPKVSLSVPKASVASETKASETKASETKANVEAKVSAAPAKEKKPPAKKPVVLMEEEDDNEEEEEEEEDKQKRDKKRPAAEDAPEEPVIKKKPAVPSSSSSTTATATSAKKTATTAVAPTKK